MDKNHHIDQLFKQGLNDFAPAPSPDVWERVAKELAQQKRSKRRVAFWWQMAASLALLLAVGSTWLLWHPHQAKEPLVATSPAQTPIMDRALPISALTSHDTASDQTSNSIAAPRHGATQDPLPTRALLAVSTAPHRAVHGKQPQPIKTHKNTDKTLPYIKPLQVSMGEPFQASSISVKPLAEKVKQEKARAYTESLLMATAQTTTPAVVRPSGMNLVLGGMATPSYSHHSQSRVKNNTRMQQSDEEGVMTMGGGLNVRIKTRSRWSFESGLIYSRIGQSERSDNRPPVLMSSSSGVVADASSMAHHNSLGTIRVKQTEQISVKDYNMIAYAPQRYSGYQGDIRQILDYIEVPFLARYRLIDRLFDVSLTGGFSANFLADNNAFVYDDNKKTSIGYTQGVDAFSVSSSLGLNIEVPLFKAFSFNMEPRFKYFLTPVNPQTGYTPYSFSMQAGFAIHF